MKYTYVPSEERVREAMQQDEPMLAAVPLTESRQFFPPLMIPWNITSC